MKIWLHWVGVKYYSIVSFIDEVKRLGVSRRVPPTVLKAMLWGDTVLLIGQSPKFPGRGILFGKMYVDEVKFTTGSKQVRNEIIDLLRRSQVRVLCAPPSPEGRGCGYESGGAYYLKTSATVEELAEVLAKSKRSKSSIRGNFWIFVKPVVLDIKPFRGYRVVEEAELKALIQRGREIEYSQLEGSIGIGVAVKHYLKAYKAGAKKDLKKLRKVFKAEGVWKEVKKITQREIWRLRREAQNA